MKLKLKLVLTYFILKYCLLSEYLLRLRLILTYFIPDFPILPVTLVEFIGNTQNR